MTEYDVDEGMHRGEPGPHYQSALEHRTLSELEVALSCVQDTVPAEMIRSLDDDQFTEVLRALSRLKNMADAAITAMIHELRERCRPSTGSETLISKYGFLSQVEYIQSTTQMSRTAALASIRFSASVGRDCTPTGHVQPARFEHLSGAFSAGLVPSQSAQLIAKTLSAARSTTEEETDYAERCLVEAATGQDCDTGNRTGIAHHADSIRVMCTAWSQVLDQDGKEPDDQRDLSRRFLSLGQQQGGLVPIRGNIVPEVAAMFGRLADAINNPRAASDKDADTEAFPDRRTHPQKLHDALATVVTVAAKSPKIPNLGGAPVSVLIQVPEREIDKAAGTAWLQDHRGNMVPTGMHAVRHAACTGSLQRYTQSKSGKIIRLESPARVFTANQRKVIVARDGGCIIPGCTIPSTWCEIHHVTPYAAGGPTHTDNGVLLCWHHHRTLDTNGWQVRMQGGVPQVKAPRWIPAPDTWMPVAPRHRVPGPAP